MTKRTRTILFLFLVATFLFAAPSLILYSQGYRADWERKKIVQTGALYVKGEPAKSEIYLNENFVKKTDTFSGSAFVGNLIPKSYQVNIQKEGYHPWGKTLEIKANQVTEIKNLILIPRNPKFQLVQKEVQDFFPSPTGKEALLKKKNLKGEWELALWNVSTHKEVPILAQQKVKENIEKIEWSRDGKRILLALIPADPKEQRRYVVFHLNRLPDDPCGKQPCSLNFLDPGIKKVSFSPDQKKILAVKSSNNSQMLIHAEYTNEKKQFPLASNIIAFTADQNNLFLLTADGFIWKKRLASNSSFESLTSQPISISKEKNYKLMVIGTNIFAQEGEEVLQLNPQTKIFETIHLSSKGIIQDPKEEKVALTNSEIWIYEFSNPHPSFLTRFSQPIDNVFWLTSHHLLFSSGNTIKIAETDSRDRINIVDLAQFLKPKLFWQRENKVLYILSEEKLYALEQFPI